MPVFPLADAAALLPPRGGLIGLDLGTKTIGVAPSDPDRRLATGVTTIERKNFTADAKMLLMLAQGLTRQRRADVLNKFTEIHRLYPCEGGFRFR